MRLDAALLVALVCSFGLGCEGEDGRPPPVQVTAGSSPGVVGGGPGGGPGGADDQGVTSGAGDDATMGGATGLGTFGATIGAATTGDLSVLSGSILTDESRFPLPMDCTIRLHEPGAVDPGTGLSSGALLDVPISVGDTQQRFDIGADEVVGIVNQGDLVYVEVRCDVNGDGAFDEFGGWYPLLPAEIVELPGEDIDLVVDDLPI
jgi:hypothetical protein